MDIMSRTKRQAALLLMLVTNTIIFMIGFVVICSNYNEPPKVEYNSHITER